MGHFSCRKVSNTVEEPSPNYTQRTFYSLNTKNTLNSMHTLGVEGVCVLGSRFPTVACLAKTRLPLRSCSAWATHTWPQMALRG